ncbi:MAG: hypothetical protein GY929_07740 [Actinomycetia bacterium]|nr:hypothetical protein [Actinomycetes bacterium]
MIAEVWNDYLCPWAWLGRDRTGLLEELGVQVGVVPYELHPEVPVGGRAHRPGGRYDQLLASIEAECHLVDLPFQRPERTPNTRQALEWAEAVRIIDPVAYPALDRKLADAHWIHGHDLEDHELLVELATGLDLDLDALEALVVSGDARRAVDHSIARAHERGVTATPSWLFDSRPEPFLLQGVQPRDTVRRWITRLLDRQRADAGPGSGEDR